MIGPLIAVVVMFIILCVVSFWAIFIPIDESGIDPNGDSRRYLTAVERLGVQCQDDADCALRLIEERKDAGWINPEWDGPYDTTSEQQNL